MKYTWMIEVGEWTANGWSYTNTYESGTNEVKEVSDIWDLEGFKNWWWDSSGQDIDWIEEELNKNEAEVKDHKWTFTAESEQGEKLMELEFWENELMQEILDSYNERY